MKHKTRNGIVVLLFVVPLLGTVLLFGFFEATFAKDKSDTPGQATENTAPVLQVTQPLTLTAVKEDTVQPLGNTVEEILASGDEDVILDPDPDALAGIAVTAVNDTNGVWQYSLAPDQDDPFNWIPFGVISDTQAILLRDTDWIRFVPAPNFSGPAGSMTFRAWDQTSGAAGDQQVDTSVNGGSTAFSVSSASASITVTAVNDAPVLEGLPVDPILFVEGGDPVPILGKEFVINDVDNLNLVSARIEITNLLDSNFEKLTVSTGVTAITATYEDGVLRLDGFAPRTDYQAVMKTILYSNTSSDPDSTDRVIRLTVNDSESTSAPGFVVVQIQLTNNPPVLDLSGTGGNGNYSAVFFINRGPVLIVSPNLLVSDSDNTTIKSAKIRIVNIRNSQAEILNARLEGDENFVRSYDVDTGVLTLTGIDSIANYQQVLRTVTYNNTLPQPNTEERIIEFTVNDGLSNSEVRTTTVAFQTAPPVRFYMPLISRRGDEPNNSCNEAWNIPVNQNQTFFANDKNDWFYFDLTQAADVTVELRDFKPAKGQIIVATEREPGLGCGGLVLVKSNGNNLPNKDVPLGRQQPGRFFIWLINDGVFDTTNPYRLLVRATP